MKWWIPAALGHWRGIGWALGRLLETTPGIVHTFLCTWITLCGVSARESTGAARRPQGRLFCWSVCVATCVIYIDEAGSPDRHDVPLQNGQTPLFTLAAMARTGMRARDSRVSTEPLNLLGGEKPDGMKPSGHPASRRSGNDAPALARIHRKSPFWRRFSRSPYWPSEQGSAFEISKVGNDASRPCRGVQSPRILTGMQFEWDPTKDWQNHAEHGVSFDEASTVFGDPFALTIDDPDHSSEENRLLTTGYSSRQQLIIVGHTDRDERVRLINAREVTPTEQRMYEEERR